MTSRNDKAGYAQPCRSRNFCTRVARILLPVAAVTVVTMADLPRLPVIGIDLGATPAFAKNDRSDRSDRGDRGNRGQGQERRNARADNAGSQIWSRPRQPDHADNGRHGGHDRAPRDVTDGRAAAPQGIIPPRRPDPEQGEFRNHGNRVSSYVALAKALGLRASVGAMQANFGTPFENNLVATDPETGALLKDPDTGEFIIAATNAEIAAVKPGDGPKTGWETETGLDVNMDGIVDRTDLELAEAAGALPDDDGRDGQGDDRPTDEENDGSDDGQMAILRIGREDGVAGP